MSRYLIFASESMTPSEITSAALVAFAPRSSSALVSASLSLAILLFISACLGDSLRFVGVLASRTVCTCAQPRVRAKENCLCPYTDSAYKLQIGVWQARSGALMLQIIISSRIAMITNFCCFPLLQKQLLCAFGLLQLTEQPAIFLNGKLLAISFVLWAVHVHVWPCRPAANWKFAQSHRFLFVWRCGDFVSDCLVNSSISEPCQCAQSASDGAKNDYFHFCKWPYGRVGCARPEKENWKWICFHGLHSFTRLIMFKWK